MSGSALSKLIVYGPGEANTVELNVIVSAPASAFAALIASHNVQPSPTPTAVHPPTPGSASVVTSNVVKLSTLKVTVLSTLVEAAFGLLASSTAALALMLAMTVPL